jgi:tripartite-type tricarboxylate transporter receptor subunit TctC
MRRLLVLMMMGCASWVQAQTAATYPSQPIKIIVPFTAGGPADGVTRFVAQRMSERWKQSVVVDNRPGAGGMIGADAAAKSAPDGYTLVLLVTGHTIMPAMQAKMPYDMPRDFTPISILNRAPKLVVVNPSVPASSLRELIALQKADPAKYSNYGTSGVGSMAHLSMELVNQLAGTKFVHVPYKGGAATLSDLLGGQLPFGVLDLGSVLPQVRSGKLKVLAVTGTTRSPVFPDLQTIGEVLPGFEADEWFGIAGPRGIPADIVAKLQHEIAAALATPEAKARYIDSLGWQLPASTPEQMGIELEQHTRKWGELVRRIGLKAE